MTEPSPESVSELRSRLFHLAWPLMGTSLLHVLALFVDTAMVAWLPDAESALAGLGFATQALITLQVAMIGLGVGAVALVSRAHGVGDRARADEVLNQAHLLMLLLGLIMGALSWVIAEPLLAIMGARGAVASAALAYLRPLLMFSVVFFQISLYSGVLRAVGNTRLPLVIGLLSNALNVALNFPLILGVGDFQGLGVQGAAFATLSSQVVSVFIYIWSLRRSADQPGLLYAAGLRLRLRTVSMVRSVMGELLAVGGPAAIDRLVIHGGFLAIIAMLGHLEETAVAAHGIGLRIQSLAFVPGLSISMAAAALVGQELGAGRSLMARRVVLDAVVACLVVMSALGLIFIVGTEPLLSIFKLDPSGLLAQRTSEWVDILGYAMPLFGINIAFVGMMQGAGYTSVSLKINLAATLCIQIPASIYLGFFTGLGPVGVWAAFPIGYLFRVAAGIYVYRRGGWLQTGLHVG